MTDIKAKALALLNEVRVERYPHAIMGYIDRGAAPTHEALCRAIEQHETFKQTVSDIVGAYVNADGGPDDWENLNSLIISKPKPDPLVEVLTDTFGASLIDADELRAALDAVGLEIRKKNND
jgi:hypothetical protein